jgi:hypothetical protein
MGIMTLFPELTFPMLQPVLAHNDLVMLIWLMCFALNSLRHIAGGQVLIERGDHRTLIWRALDMTEFARWPIEAKPLTKKGTFFLFLFFFVF